jgi:hypothetical protein
LVVSEEKAPSSGADDAATTQPDPCWTREKGTELLLLLPRRKDCSDLLLPTRRPSTTAFMMGLPIITHEDSSRDIENPEIFFAPAGPHL